MKQRTLFKVAAQSIAKNKMRTALTMLGIVIGVAAVIVMVAVGQGAQSQIQEQINNLGSNMIVVTAGATTTGGVSQGAREFNRLSLADYEKLEREAYLLAGVSPVIQTRTHVIGPGGNWRTHINGVSAEYQAIRNWPTAQGAFFAPIDVRTYRRVAVLGVTVAENLYPGQDPIGQQIQLRDVPFTVIGVLARKGQTASGDDQDDVILVPYTTAETRLSGWQRIGQILANTYSTGDLAAAQQEMRLILSESHDIAEGDEDDFTIRNQNDLAEAAQGTTQVMSVLLAAIASVSLLVGGIGIMNIMLVSVTERTREIGIRMAIGARGSDVLTQFLVESVVMSLMGGVLGIAVGFGGAALLARLTGWSTVVAPEAVLVAVGFSAAVGVFFGFYPARKASSLNPIEALRYE